ncbi:MAG: hypothetical protein RL266_1019 [Bacteroidota bacterium]|jgi:tetratricopeptide (TPR) repeat protein
MLVVFLVFSIPLPGLGQSLQELQEKAEEQLKTGNYAKAAKFYDKMIKLRPDSAALYGLKGNCLCWGGNRDESFEAYAQGLALEPENPRLFLQRGTCFHEYQLLDNAVQDFTDGLKYATTDTLKRALYFNRAASKASYMDVRGALEDNLSALKYDSLDAGIHNNIGITYGDLKQFDKAEYHLKKVLELDSTFEGGLMNLGFMYSEMEAYEKALPVLDMAVKAFPDQPFPYNNRGWVKHKLGNSKDGIKDIEASLKLFNGNSYAYRNLALIHHSLGNNELACENAMKALQLNYSTNYGDEMELFYKNHCTK